MMKLELFKETMSLNEQQEQSVVLISVEVFSFVSTRSLKVTGKNHGLESTLPAKFD